MKPGTPCIHCTDTGCAIYDRRPVDPCRNFVCSWVEENSPLPEHFKPSECGVIIRLNYRWKGIKVISAVATSENFPPQILEYLSAYARKTSTPLIWAEDYADKDHIGNRKGQGFGPPDFINAVKDHLKVDDFLEM